MTTPPRADERSDKRLAVFTVATVALVFLVVFGTRLIVPSTTSGSPSLPLWVLTPAAYLGGVLALLSPCSGAILPGFFAYSFETEGDLVRGTYVFYLGLALVFVPVGGASSLVQGFVVEHASLVFSIGGAVLILLGLTALTGFDLTAIARTMGFQPSRVGQDRVQSARDTDTKVYLMGAVFGFATSSCTAPILGSLVAVTIGTGLTPVAGVVLFLVFALGIVTPLFLMAVFFEDSTVLRKVSSADPVTLSLAGKSHDFHPVHLASGTLLIALGVLFIATRGTLDLTSQYAEWGLIDLYDEWTLAIQSFFATGVGQLVAAASLLALLGLAGLLFRRIRATA